MTEMINLNPKKVMNIHDFCHAISHKKCREEKRKAAENISRQTPFYAFTEQFCAAFSVIVWAGRCSQQPAVIVSNDRFWVWSVYRQCSVRNWQPCCDDKTLGSWAESLHLAEFLKRITAVQFVLKGLISVLYTINNVLFIFMCQVEIP